MTLGISTLFEASPEGYVTRAGARPVLNPGRDGRQSDVSLELLTPIPTPALFQSGIHTVPPGARSDGRVQHEGEDFGYILEGVLELYVGDQTFTLGRGDTFFFPSTIPHAYFNSSTKTTRVLWFNTPPTF